MKEPIFLCLRIPSNKVYSIKQDQIQLKECCERQFGPKEVCCPICTRPKQRYESRMVYESPFDAYNMQLPLLDPGGKGSYERDYYIDRCCWRFLEFECVMISNASSVSFEHFDVVIGRIDRLDQLPELMPQYQEAVEQLKQVGLQKEFTPVFAKFYDSMQESSLEIVNEKLGL